jgi:hypothetical protein
MKAKHRPFRMNFAPFCVTNNKNCLMFSLCFASFSQYQKNEAKINFRLLSAISASKIYKITTFFAIFASICLNFSHPFNKFNDTLKPYIWQTKILTPMYYMTHVLHDLSAIDTVCCGKPFFCSFPYFFIKSNISPPYSCASSKIRWSIIFSTKTNISSDFLVDSPAE